MKEPKIFDYKNIYEVDLINCPLVLYDDYKLLQEKIRNMGGCPHIVNWDECILVCKECWDNIKD